MNDRLCSKPKPDMVRNCRRKPCVEEIKTELPTTTTAAIVAIKATDPRIVIPNNRQIQINSPEIKRLVHHPSHQRNSKRLSNTNRQIPQIRETRHFIGPSGRRTDIGGITPASENRNKVVSRSRNVHIQTRRRRPMPTRQRPEYPSSRRQITIPQRRIAAWKVYPWATVNQ